MPQNDQALLTQLRDWIRISTNPFGGLSPFCHSCYDGNNMVNRLVRCMERLGKTGLAPEEIGTPVFVRPGVYAFPIIANGRVVLSVEVEVQAVEQLAAIESEAQAFLFSQWVDPNLPSNAKNRRRAGA